MAPMPRSSTTDSLPTPTSESQAETEAILLQQIPVGLEGKAPLNKNAHMQFLIKNLIQGFPQRYTSQDASQPWLVFWTTQAFSALKVSIDAENRQRIIDRIIAAQHPNGGFGGGPGQSAHLLPTYASVSALAIVGRPGPDGGWDQIDRKKMYDFFMSLKQPDGSFLVAHHAEVDVRGVYCLLVTATLLNILTPALVEGTASFVASCQTYEGGFASASQPYYAAPPSTPSQRSSSSDAKLELLDSPRPPLGEAHGGYTFCCLASWVLLSHFRRRGEGRQRDPEINVKMLLRWLVMMQGTEIEIGGFRGRTNKLVDGCYSWWCGGAFALLKASGVDGPGSDEPMASAPDESNEDWHDVDDFLFNRKALQEYILYAGQHPAGGLRDKPPMNPDAYHTSYCLSGLSAAQHHVYPSNKRRERIRAAWVTPEHPAGELGTITSTLTDSTRRQVFEDALSWTQEEGGSFIVGGQGNHVNATHPLFNLTITHSEGIMAHFYRQTLPPRSRIG